MAKYRISKERKALIESISEVELTAKVLDLAQVAGVSTLLEIPGVFDLVSDALNNAAIDALVEAKEAASPTLTGAK